MAKRDGTKSATPPLFLYLSTSVFLSLPLSLSFFIVIK